jgi:hypothetical protein
MRDRPLGSNAQSRVTPSSAFRKVVFYFLDRPTIAPSTTRSYGITGYCRPHRPGLAAAIAC